MNDTIEFSKVLRKHVLQMIYKAKASHIGSCFSIADIIAVLYGKILNVNPQNPSAQNRDRFILSKGHAAAIVYAALAEKGFFPKEWLSRYCEDASPLSGHITHKFVPGVEVSTGSLGHGLPIACGMSYAIKKNGGKEKTYVVMSDGELNEGSNWEAILFAAHHKLSSLIVFVDYNKIQSYGMTNEVLNLESLKDKWEAFNWNVQEINGHNHNEIEYAINVAKSSGNFPSVIIANTIKGNGVSFMENKIEWHYRSPSEEELKMALKEIEGINEK
jgi:transketolase